LYKVFEASLGEKRGGVGSADFKAKARGGSLEIKGDKRGAWKKRAGTLILPQAINGNVEDKDIRHNFGAKREGGSK